MSVVSVEFSVIHVSALRSSPGRRASDRRREVYDPSTLRAIGDNAARSNSLGNIVLKGVGATNWQGNGAEVVKALSAQRLRAREALPCSRCFYDLPRTPSTATQNTVNVLNTSTSQNTLNTVNAT